MALSTAPASAAETPPRAGPSRLPSLTGMRFIAAALVFFFHTFYEIPFRDPSAQDVYGRIVGQGGWTGVGFFFVLSGFVLTWSVRPSDPARRIWRRRLFKIYPNHIVTYIAAFALLVFVSGATVPLYDALVNLFLLQAWDHRLSVEVSVNPVAWSLSCEALFYLCFPFLLRGIRKIRADLLWPCAGVIAGVVFIIPVLATLFPGRPQLFFAPVSDWQFWFVYVLPPIRCLDFVLGMLMARIVQTGRWIPLRLGPAAALVVGAYAAAYYLPWTYSLVSVMLVPLALLIPAGAVADIKGHRSLLRGRVMVWLGEVSFALYLWHRLVMEYVTRWLGDQRAWGTAEGVALIALSLAVTLLLAWLLFRFVEAPIMRRWSTARRRTPASPEHVRPPARSGRPRPGEPEAISVETRN